MKVSGFKHKAREAGVETKDSRKKRESKKTGRGIWSADFSPITGIKRKTLMLILEASKEAIPNEFSGTLRAKDGIIDEVMLLPGTVQGETTAIMYLYMLPVDLSVVGSAHSHPSGAVYPSGADLQLFSKFGRVHIITGNPFTLHNWRAFDHTGNEIHIDVVD